MGSLRTATSLNVILIYVISAMMITGVLMYKSTHPTDIDSAAMLKRCDVASFGEMKSKYFDNDATLVNYHDVDGWSCLIMAGKNGNEELVVGLLKYGAKADPEVEFKHSALRGSAMYGHVNVIKALLRAGGRVDVRSKGDKTALMGAAMNGHLPVVRVLLEAGADATIKNEFGETALDLARQNGNIDIIALLSSA